MLNNGPLVDLAAAQLAQGPRVEAVLTLPLAFVVAGVDDGRNDVVVVRPDITIAQASDTNETSTPTNKTTHTRDIGIFSGGRAPARTA